jgi:hypothetical protein
MAIYRKTEVENRLKGLEDYYLQLRAALEGRVPDNYFAAAYSCTKEEFTDRYVSINFDEVLLRVDHFKAEVAAIKALKARAQKPRAH